MIQGERQKLTSIERYTISTLVYLELIFFIDRHSVEGMYSYINKSFNIGEEGMHNLNDVEAVMFMLASPVVGYFCDRRSRKKLIVNFVAVWAMITLITSLVERSDLFFMCRGITGIATAFFSHTAPTIIADVTINEVRSMAICIYYCALPFGTGLGLMLTNKVAQLCDDDWRWSLRLLTGLIICSYVLLDLSVDPKRGEIELAGRKDQLASVTSYYQDLRFFFTNKSFLILVFANGAMTFCSNLITWWVPKIFLIGMKRLERNHELASGDVMQSLGVLLMLSGIYGVPFGTLLSLLLRSSMPWIDPIIYGLGLVAFVPLFFLSVCVCDSDDQMAYALLFFAQISLNMCWGVFIDMAFYITPPTRRGTAMAMLSFIPDLMGVCMGRLVTHALYDFYTTVDITSDEFTCIQLTILSVLPIGLFGGLVQLLGGMVIVSDRERAKKLLIVAT